MRKVISLALVAMVIALPAPATPMLAPATPPPLTPAVAPAANFALLLADPFLIDALSYVPPRSVGEVS